MEGQIDGRKPRITEAVAGRNHPFYAFEGLKPDLKTNWVLHITSNHFDGPTAVSIVSRAERAIVCFR